MDDRINPYDPNSNEIKNYLEGADRFLQNMNFEFAAKAVESVHTKHLDNFASNQAALIDKISAAQVEKAEEVAAK